MNLFSEFIEIIEIINCSYDSQEKVLIIHRTIYTY